MVSHNIVLVNLYACFLMNNKIRGITNYTKMKHREQEQEKQVLRTEER